MVSALLLLGLGLQIPRAPGEGVTRAVLAPTPVPGQTSLGDRTGNGDGNQRGSDGLSINRDPESGLDWYSGGRPTTGNHLINYRKSSPSIETHLNKDISSWEKLFILIRTYYSFRNIYNLNIYTCNVSDALFLLKSLSSENFQMNVKSKFAKSIYKPPMVEGNFVDLSCDQNRQIFNKMGVLEDLWLIWGAERMVQRTDSDVVLADSEGRLFDLAETWKPAGSWSPPQPLLPDRKLRFNLNGRTLKGVIVELHLKYDIYNNFKEITNNYIHPNIEVPERYTFVLSFDLAQLFNFKFDVMAANTWGLKQSNGSFNGMIGLLERKKADFGMVAVDMREERFPIVLFIPPVQRIRFVYLFLEERALGTYKALLIPFTLGVWLCTIAVVLLAATIYGVIYKGELFQGVVFVIGIIAQQGLAVDGDRLPFRILSIFLLLLGLILYTYYNAAIMNGLLSPSPVTIRTVGQLIKSPLRIVIANVPYLNFAFNQKKYIPGEILSRIQSSPDWLLDVIPALEKVRRERFSLCSDDISLYPFIEETYSDGEKCNIRELEVLRPFHLAMPLRKDTQYKEMFTQGIIQLLENGIASRERTRWYPEKPHCLGSTVFMYVSLEAVSVALMCFAFGLITSILIFTIEIFISKKFEKRLNKI